MNYKKMKASIEAMANENYEDFIKGMISFEKGINDEKALDSIYKSYMDNDTQELLNDEFDYVIWKKGEISSLLVYINDVDTLISG